MDAGHVAADVDAGHVAAARDLGPRQPDGGSAPPAQGPLMLGAASIPYSMVWPAIRRPLISFLEEHDTAGQGKRLADLLKNSADRTREGVDAANRKLDAIAESLRELQAVVKAQNDIAVRTFDELTKDTGYLNKEIHRAGMDTALSKMTAQTKPAEPGMTLPNTNLHRYLDNGRQPPSDADRISFIKYAGKHSNLDAVKVITTALPDYVDGSARYLAISALDQDDGTDAMGALDAQFLALIGAEIQGFQVDSLRFQFNDDLAVKQDLGATDFKNLSLDYQNEFAIQARTYLKAAAMLAGMLGSSPARVRGDHRGLTTNTELEAALARSTMIALAFRSVTRPIDPSQTLVSFAVLARGVDTELRAPGAAEPAGAGRVAYIDNVVGGGVARPVPNGAMPDLSVEADSLQAGRYGVFTKAAGGGVSLSFASTWHLDAFELALPGRPTDVVVNYSFGQGASAQHRSVHLTAEANPDAKLPVIVARAEDLRYEGQSTRALTSGMFEPAEHTDGNIHGATWHAVDEQASLLGVSAGSRALIAGKLTGTSGQITSIISAKLDIRTGADDVKVAVVYRTESRVATGNLETKVVGVAKWIAVTSNHCSRNRYISGPLGRTVEIKFGDRGIPLLGDADLDEKPVGCSKPGSFEFYSEQRAFALVLWSVLAQVWTDRMDSDPENFAWSKFSTGDGPSDFVVKRAMVKLPAAATKIVVAASIKEDTSKDFVGRWVETHLGGLQFYINGSVRN